MTVKDIIFDVNNELLLTRVRAARNGANFRPFAALTVAVATIRVAMLFI